MSDRRLTQKQADRALLSERKCFVCFTHYENDSELLIYDAELHGFLCDGVCLDRANAARHELGHTGRRRLRPVNAWKDVVRAMRPREEQA